MQLGYVGINYKNTDLSVRDKITFTDSGIADFMQQAEEVGVKQCMCLSTCNRCEVFYLYEDETFVQVMSDLFNDTTDISIRFLYSAASLSASFWYALLYIPSAPNIVTYIISCPIMKKHAVSLYLNTFCMILFIIFIPHATSFLHKVDKTFSMQIHNRYYARYDCHNHSLCCNNNRNIYAVCHYLCCII